MARTTLERATYEAPRMYFTLRAAYQGTATYCEGQQVAKFYEFKLKRYEPKARKVQKVEPADRVAFGKHEC
jgi:hypothetical protein